MASRKEKAKKLGDGTIQLASEQKKLAKKGNPSAPQAQVAPYARWWTLAKEHIGGAIRATVEHVQKNQSSLELQRQICARLYGGTTPGNFYGVTYDRLQVLHPSMSGRLTYNLVAIVVDSLVSRITKSKVRPLFLTQGGDYRLQRRAKKLSQFADGIFYEAKFDDLAPMIFRDGCIFGDGIVHVYEDPNTGRVAIERCLASELYVDEIDGFYGNPQQMHRAKFVDRQKVIEAWATNAEGKVDKDTREMIERAGSGTQTTLRNDNQFVADTVAVVESWKLPSSPTAHDGRHMITIDTGVLLDEPYEKRRFPFSRFSWKPRVYGWHGASLVEELVGTQVEMNHLLHMMQRAFRLMAAFKIVVENGTVPDQHFNDKIGTILHVPKGSMKPEYLAPPALNPQYFQHFEQVKARGFEIARLSQMSATSQKPAGLDSGEAQRVYHDIETEGFQHVGHMYEQFHLDTIALVIDVVRDIFERENKYELRAPVGASSLPGRKFLRTIDWKQVKLDEDEYSLKCYPTSSLPQTPAGRLATVQDLTRAGFIDEATSRKLLDFPDLAQVETLLGAAEDWIVSCLDLIIEDGKFTPPDPYMNLAMAETLGLQEYALGAANKMEAEKLENLGRWIQQVQSLKQKALAASQPPAPPLGAGATPPGPLSPPNPGMGAPAPAPVSPLLPPGGAPIATA
jgi:hypothetical protein